MGPILKTTDIKIHFPIKQGLLSRTRGFVRAVDGVTLAVDRGTVLGLVGESGCGKTTLGRAILRLIECTEGRIEFDSKDITRLSGEKLRQMRRRMQIIFQDPYSSLNPRMTVAQTIGEALKTHGMADKNSRTREVKTLLDKVGLSAEHMSRYPHEFSGGQRQRIGIARALAVKPEFIVTDEPVSALDVSIQSQILNLLNDLRKEMNLTLLFISHDLRVISHMADNVAVMYLGRIMENAPAKSLFNNPMHPYTKALLSAVPLPDPKTNRKRIVLTGDVPDPSNPPTGCPFHPRCPEVMDICSREPVSLWKQDDGREVACLKFRK